MWHMRDLWHYCALLILLCWSCPANAANPPAEQASHPSVAPLDNIASFLKSQDGYKTLQNERTAQELVGQMYGGDIKVDRVTYSLDERGEIGSIFINSSHMCFIIKEPQEKDEQLAHEPGKGPRLRIAGKLDKFTNENGYVEALFTNVNWVELAPGVLTLIDAAAMGNVDRVKALIAAHADVNAKRKDGWTALMYASQAGNTEMVKALIAAHADVNASDNDGNTVLSLAGTGSGKPAPEVVEALKAAGADLTPPGMEGAGRGGLRAGDVLPAMGGGGRVVIVGGIPTSTGPSTPYKTALMAAAAKGDVGSVKTQIADHADVNAKDKFGNSVLICAVIRGSVDCVNALIAAHADVNAKKDNGRTALMYASLAGNTEMVKALIAAHADVNAKDNDGKTALIWAGTGWGQPAPEVVAELKAAGATQ